MKSGENEWGVNDSSRRLSLTVRQRGQRRKTRENMRSHGWRDPLTWLVKEKGRERTNSRPNFFFVEGHTSIHVPFLLYCRPIAGLMPVMDYLVTRFTSLKPPMILPENPIKLLRKLNRRQAAFFVVAFLAWTWDAFDYFCVTLNIKEIGKTFNRSAADVTWSITVTLMFRSIGGVLFGIAGDRFGRKWPFIINIVFYAIIEIGTGFVSTYAQFIGLRAVFGVAMGGIYGNCAATALEDAPIAARGLLSGLLQQGYACGFLLAAGFNYAITNHQRYGWRALFWFGGAPPLLVAFWRLFLPETQAFLNVKKAREDNVRSGQLNYHSSWTPVETHVVSFQRNPKMRLKPSKPSWRTFVWYSFDTGPSWSIWC